MPLSTSTFRPLFNAAGQTARAFSTSSPRAIARAMVTGRLASEPQLLSTSSGREVIKYTIASDYGPMDRRQASFFRVASFAASPQKEFLLNLQKGSFVFVEGDARVKQWSDAEGKLQSSFSIIQSHLELLRRPSAAYQQAQQPQEGQEQGSSEQPPQ